SDNYYRDVFKPIIESLSTRTEKNTLCNSQPTELKKIETKCSSNEDDDDELNSSFEHFFNNKRSTIKRYNKSYVVVKSLYERIKHEEKQLNKHIAKINNLKSPQINLTSIKDHLFSWNAKRSNVNDDMTMKNEPFYFNPKENSSMVTDPAVENMFNFTLTPQPKKGSGLYKDVIPQTQLVYYDDPNELVTRLNLLTSSQSVGSTVRKIFPRRSVVTRFIDDLWQADLMDMQSHSRQNYGFKYILVVIDTYSKYVWVEALKNKISKECTNGMFNILKKAHPKLLQTDN
ncbi:Integrase catalytic domain-containing protein, partial [Aphis craccivora]